MITDDQLAGLLDLDGATTSVLLRHLDTGETIAADAPNTALAPASNTKLITTALALDRLGPDHRFETRVAGYGTVRDGRLDGDVVLRGTGTPDLDASDLRTLAVAVREAGVTGVDGDLVLDASAFEGGELGPGWMCEDEQYSYGARSSALALARNTVDVTVRRSQESEYEICVAPDTDAVTVENELGVDETGDEKSDGDHEGLSVWTDREHRIVRVEGSIAPDTERTERAPIPDPIGHIGPVFAGVLAEEGVTVAGSIRTGTEPSTEPTVAEIVRSERVETLVREMNVPSDNFIAEQLARAVASIDGDGSWETWEEIVTEFFGELGVETLRIKDGSGLSRYNLIPARGLVALFEWTTERAWHEAFLDSLPAPGEGTLTDRLTDVDAAVRAKTGTLTGTCALSGVVQRDDSEVAFSILLSSLTDGVEAAQNTQDTIVRLLANQ